MNRAMIHLLVVLGLLWPLGVGAQGVIPFALAQQIDANGQPLSGALLYIYQAGTISTPQDTFQDFGLTMPLQWPLRADITGRIPMFYLAAGAVHARLTNAAGVVIVDVPSLQVVGNPPPTTGGGGTVDPATIFTTGDVKYRPTSEALAGWVKLNALTIGSAVSGATGRANNDTQALYVYLWSNCPQSHCPVTGGRGSTALSDFGANKTLEPPDWRGLVQVGLDGMGNSRVNRVLDSNVTSPGDNADAPGASGGLSNQVMTLAQMPNHLHTINDPTHSHAFNYQNELPMGAGTGSIGFNSFGVTQVPCAPGVTTGCAVASASTGITINSTGSSDPMPLMPPFVLGTWYMKL